MINPDCIYQWLLKSAQHRKLFLVAYSGGVDSHVLLHLMNLIRQKYSGIRLRAIHINHGLSPNADQWSEHCQTVCDNLQIELLIRKIKLNRDPNHSTESLSRQIRYQIFSEVLLLDESLLTAHTQNDQAETVLLQLLRGAGPKGLSAMPDKKAFAQSYLLRPLLNFTREEVVQYANQNRLHWVEDESNLDLGFNRNYLRHKIMPLLQNRWESVFSNLSRSANHCAESVELLDELARNDLLTITQENDFILPLAHVLTLSDARQRNVLRYWIRKCNVRLPSTRKLKQLQTDLLLSRKDARPSLQWDDFEIRRYQNQLYLMPILKKHNSKNIIPWDDVKKPLDLGNGLGHLIAEKKIGEGIRPDITTQHISVRFRQGGETCQFKGHTHSLKKLFQEWHIPPWQRDNIPLIYCGNELIAVVGYCVCDGFATNKEQVGIVIKFQFCPHTSVLKIGR